VYAAGIPCSLGFRQFNAAGAFDYVFKTGVIARSRSTLGSSPFCHGERFHVIVG
jgi:hypothetical protein